MLDRGSVSAGVIWMDRTEISIGAVTFSTRNMNMKIELNRKRFS